MLRLQETRVSKSIKKMVVLYFMLFCLLVIKKARLYIHNLAFLLLNSHLSLLSEALQVIPEFLLQCYRSVL